MAARTAISGAACKVFLASTGAESGWATGVDVTESIQNQRVDVVGDIDSQEIVPVRRTAQMQVSAIRVSAEALEEYISRSMPPEPEPEPVAEPVKKKTTKKKASKKKASKN